MTSAVAIERSANEAAARPARSEGTHDRIRSSASGLGGPTCVYDHGASGPERSSTAMGANDVGVYWRRRVCSGRIVMTKPWVLRSSTGRCHKPRLSSTMRVEPMAPAAR